MNTYGSLFAGVGGFDMGFDRAGYDCRFQVEWDKNCQNILNRHWPDVPKWWDVSEVNGAELPPVDVLIFGSPCQDLSVAGKRAGLDGARSGLFYEAMRIIKEMRDATANTFPRVVVWENVVGALNSNGGADFGAVLDQMAEAGALVVEWAVLDAQHFGVPQRRRRVFVVAVLDPASAGRCPDPLLPVGESVRRDTQARGTARETAAGTPAECFGNGSYGGWKPADQAVTLMARDYKQGTTVAVYGITGHVVGRSDTAGPNGPSHTPEGGPMFTLTSTDRHAVAFDEYNGTVNDGTHHALRAGTKQSNGVVTESTVRRLTPVECERLMGWPDDHTLLRADGKEQADTHRYRQCGNGVATPVAQWIANQITSIL